MADKIKAVKNAIRFLQDRIEELEDVEAWGYEIAIRFLKEYVSEVEDELEYDCTDNYHTIDSYYNF